MNQSDNRFYREPPKKGELARYLWRRARWYAGTWALVSVMIYVLFAAAGLPRPDLRFFWWVGFVAYCMGLYGNSEFDRLWIARKQILKARKR